MQPHGPCSPLFGFLMGKTQVTTNIPVMISVTHCFLSLLPSTSFSYTRYHSQLGPNQLRLQDLGLLAPPEFIIASFCSDSCTTFTRTASFLSLQPWHWTYIFPPQQLHGGYITCLLNCSSRSRLIKCYYWRIRKGDLRVDESERCICKCNMGSRQTPVDVGSGIPAESRITRSTSGSLQHIQGSGHPWELLAGRKSVSTFGYIA